MDRIYDLIIVGGGPAALSAAFYALSKRINMVMLYEELGGKVGWRQRFTGPAEHLQRAHQGPKRLDEALLTDIVDLEPAHLPGNELVRLLISQTAMQAGQVVHDRAVHVAQSGTIFLVDTQRHGAVLGAAVIVATGAAPIHLNLPGGSRRFGQALGYSMTTYAHLVAGKAVAVIGATPRALRGAAELARTAERVFLIAPDAVPAGTSLHALLERPNVEYLAGFTVKEVVGAAALRGLVVERAGERRCLGVERAFVDLGLVPRSEMVRDLVRTDPAGFIVVDDHNATSVPGIFAAGDVTTAFCEQVLVAVGDGVRAATSAYDYLLAEWAAAGTSVTTGATA